MEVHLLIFFYQNQIVPWDERIEENVTPDELCAETIELFKRFAQNRIPSIVYETDIGILLKKMNLMTEKGITKAAVLLFGKDTQKYYRQAVLKIGKFLSDRNTIN